MIAILYRDCLLLATAERTEQVYIIQAKIVLDDVRVESVDNGRGTLLLMVCMSLAKYTRSPMSRYTFCLETRL